jgi:hypothetical protein
MLGQVTSIYDVDEAVRANANRPWSSQPVPVPRSKKAPGGIEGLDPGVASIGHVHSASRVHGNPMRQVELAAGTPRLPPLPDELAIGVELDNPGVAVAIADIHRAINALRHVGGSIEMRPIGAWDPPLPKRKEWVAFGIELEYLMESYIS